MNIYLLLVLAALMSIVVLIFMYYSNRGKLFRHLFVISMTTYLAIIGIIILRLLGEKDPFVIIFLLFISLSTFLIMTKVNYKT